MLQRKISEKEVELALHQCCSDKAPGPGGLNAGTLKFLWPSIKDCLIKSFHNFFESGQLPKGMNSSFITLIPKIPKPLSVKDFRLISLINCSLENPF